MKELLVSFIVGNYNGESILAECLDAILAQKAAPIEVIVVDDASRDGSVEVVKSYPDVKLLTNEGNQGLAVCRNQGLAVAAGHYVAFIDNDAVLAPDWLDMMLEAVREWPDARLFASHLVFYDNPDTINGTGGYMNLAGYAWARSIYRAEEEVQDSPYIFFPCGAAMFMTREFLDEVGEFDKTYNYGYDDVELGWRALMRGYKVIYVPGARARHRFSYTVGRYNPRKLYLYERNRIRALLKNLEGSILRDVLPDVASLFFHRIGVEMTKPDSSFTARVRFVSRKLQALAWNLLHLRSTLRERRKTAAMRIVSDQELVNAGLIYNTVDTPPITVDPPLLDYEPCKTSSVHGKKKDLRMVDRDAAYLGDGWYNQEHTPKGVRFRWTEREAVAMLADPSGPKRLIIETILANPHEDTRVDVEVNGKLAGTLTVATGPARHELKLSPEAMNGHLEVRLRVQNPFNPSELIGVEDRRLLGVAVTRIAVK